VTDPDLTHAPPVLHALVSDLVAAGFVVVPEGGGGPVNRVVELAGPWCRVRMTADRGQWRVELGWPPQVDWYDPDVWRACLDDEALAAEPSSLDDQADFVRGRWTEVAVASPEVDACLARTRERRARGRPGLPPQDRA
jgi:hypothetical protein